MADNHPTAFPETIIAGKPDSEYLLRDHVATFPVPEWVPMNSVKLCFHCTSTLKMGQKHNCRLCGKVYCSRCSSKYHLPDKYELKNKAGPTRVCYGCKLTCLRMRQAALSLPLDSATRTLFPPRWQTMASYFACNKCCIKRSNPHNCRACGLLFCNDCSAKLPVEIPSSFNRKGKDGPQRFCDGCRYRLYSGARMSDGTDFDLYDKLFQDQLRRVQEFEASLEAGQSLTAAMKNYNATGPVKPNALSVSTSSRGDGSNTANQDIRIVYANNQKMPVQTIELQNDEKADVDPSPTVPIITAQQSSVSAELSQVLGKMNLDATTTPKVQPGASRSATTPVYHLSQLAPNKDVAPASSTTASAAMQPINNTPQGSSTPKSPHHRTLARSQRYQQVKQSGGARQSLSVNNNFTTIRRTDSVSLSLSPPANDISPNYELTGVENDDEIPPPPPPPESDEEQPPPQQQSSIVSHVSTLPITTPNARMRPPGAKDIYNKMSIVRDAPLVITRPTNVIDQSGRIDEDCKDDEYERGPDPNKHIPSHESLVKPSQLFANRQGNNKPKPAYLNEDQQMSRINRG